MSADLADLHDELRSVARDLLTPGRLATGVDRQLLGRTGWLGLEVPAELDGAEATFAEVAVVCEELGRAAAPSPYLGAAVLGVGALALAEPGPRRDALLRDLGAGDVTAAVALDGEGDDPADDLAAFRLEGVPGQWRVHGRATFVPDAPGAARLLVLAADPRGEVAVVELDGHAPGLAVTDQPVLDETRRLGTVTADGVAVDDDAVWPVAGDPASGVRRLRERAAVALACDSVGLAAAMLERTVAYVGMREQFGRPVGSFQAVKHACADMLVQVSVSRQLAHEAVRLLAAEQSDASDVAVAVAMAKSHAADTAVAVAGTAMQLHGGIGYTWESGIHVHLKRAALNRSLFGSPAAHRSRLAARYR